MHVLYGWHEVPVHVVVGEVVLRAADVDGNEGPDDAGHHHAAVEDDGRGHHQANVREEPRVVNANWSRQKSLQT